MITKVSWEDNSESRLNEPSQVSNEIQVWTQIEQNNNDRIVNMREEMDNKFEAKKSEPTKAHLQYKS